MLEINLFDSNFNHSCSTAYQTSQYIKYVNKKKEYNGITIFTDEWINNKIMPEVESKIKIGWLREPFCLHSQTYEKTLNRLYYLDFCLTYHEGFLKLHNKFRFIPYGGIWIPQSHWRVHEKTKSISMLVGEKKSTSGHIIRQNIATSHRFNPAIDFYGIYGLPVDYSWQTKYNTLADYRFSIITETCLENNLFTEWLLDAFIVGTIPIYWGCPNIGNFFNANGVIQFETEEKLNDVLQKLQAIGPEMVYNSMRDAAQDNFNLAQEYAVTEDWLYLNVLKDIV